MRNLNTTNNQGFIVNGTSVSEKEYWVNYFKSIDFDNIDYETLNNICTDILYNIDRDDQDDIIESLRIIREGE